MMGERLLSGPRAIVHDLVAKRLWPIAIVLVVALVAVPILLAGSGSTPPPAAPAAAVPAAQTAEGTPITVVEQPVLGRKRPGAVRDPFFDPPAPKTQSTASSSSSPSPTSTSTSTSTSGESKPATTGGATPPATATPDPTPASPAPASPSAASIYRARVRWGADATADTRGISRLEPLGGTSNPALLYLGTTADHKRAVFLLGPNAAIADEQLCTDTSCRVIALKAGQSVAVGVVGLDGAPDRGYELGVTSIPAVAVADRAAALARVHADGREVLRAMIKDPSTAEAIGQYTFDRSLGAVVRIDAP